MAAQNPGDLFDTYFQKADLDRDGRISGAEAVAFFQGSNLPKQVLAQVSLCPSHFLSPNYLAVCSSALNLKFW